MSARDVNVLRSGTRLDPVQTTLQRMESYVQFDHRSDVEFYSRHQEREESPHLLQHQAQLPSFRDIIPPHLQPAPDAQFQSGQAFEAPSDILTPSTQGLSATPRSTITSPVHSQSSSMPALTGEFEDMNVRSTEAMFSTQAHAMGSMDRSAATWIPASQYQSMSTDYAQPTQRVSPSIPQPVASRTSSTLPPIRDNNQRTNSYDPTYATPSGQMNHVSQLGSYPQMYATAQPTNTDMDTTGYARSMSYNDGQYARYATPYSQTSRPYQTTDYTRFGTTAPYDYRYSNPTYRPSYADMNYAPHAMVGSQPATFGVQGDLSGGGHPRRRRGNLPKPVTDILRSWFHDHLDHPYPSEDDKQIFIQKTGLSISQISNWFINARRRHWPALRQNREQARNSAALRRSNSAGGSI